MRHDRRFSLSSAFAATERGEIALWVGDFLSSRGSDNEILAAALARHEWWWLGPIRLPIERLERLAGPEDDVLVPVDEDEWEEDVEDMEESLEEGWEPPPLLVEYQDGKLLLQDGNHRYEALARADEREAWVLVMFPTEDELERFKASEGVPL